MDYSEEEEDEGDDAEETGENGESSNGHANGNDAKAEDPSNNRLYGNSTTQERDEQNEKQIKFMKENYGHIFRSKGFLWIAGRDDQYAEWSQAGTIGKLF